MRQELDWQLGLIVKKYNRKLCFNSFFSRTYRMGNNFPDSWFSVRYSLQNLSPTPMIVSCFIGNFYLMTFLPSNVFSVSSNLSNLVYFHIERGKARHCCNWNLVLWVLILPVALSALCPLVFTLAWMTVSPSKPPAAAASVSLPGDRRERCSRSRYLEA